MPRRSIHHLERRSRARRIEQTERIVRRRRRIIRSRTDRNVRVWFTPARVERIHRTDAFGTMLIGTHFHIRLEDYLAMDRGQMSREPLGQLLLSMDTWRAVRQLGDRYPAPLLGGWCQCYHCCPAAYFSRARERREVRREAVEAVMDRGRDPAVAGD